MLTHNSDNRDAVLKKHTTTKKATVLLSPSMTEGVDLKGDLSRFQVICKIPYPYLGDQIVRKRMYKHKDWYGLQTAKSIVQSCGRSVRSNTDTAVTYILDSDWNRFENILNSLDKIIKSGKIRYLGLSNETAWGLSKFLEISKLKNLPKIMSVQNPYSLLNRTYEVGLAEISIREESGLLAYSPLAFGYLTGKYRNGELPKNSRMKLFGSQFDRYKTKNGQLAIEKYYEIANKHRLDFAQMSLKFCEVQPFITSVIIGATTMDQLKTNIESVNIKISDEVIKEINEVQKIYPNPCP